MNILVITCMFPCKRHPTSALFFSNLMKELVYKVDELVIVTPRVYIPRFLTKIKKSWSKWYLDPMYSKDNGMEIIRPYFLSLRGIGFTGINGVLMQYSLNKVVKALIKTKKIDLILGYNMLPEGIATVRLAKKFKLPAGFWVIGTDVNDFAKFNHINHYLSKKCIEDSQLIIAESKDLENIVRGFTSKNLNVNTFYKGIDISNFQNLPSDNNIMQMLKLNPGKKYILFAGRLIYDKGIYELAKAFNNITKQYSDIDLIMVGEEFEKEKLQLRFNEYGLLNRVHFQGIVSHRNVACLMKISYLLVLPTWAEGLPNVVMEAMAIGLPVVATNVGGIPEILKNEVNGLSVPPKDTERLTEAILRMMEDHDLRRNCIENAQKLVMEEFDVKKNTIKLHNILNKLLSN